MVTAPPLGVHAVDQQTQVVSIYVSTSSHGQSVDNGRAAAQTLFDKDADVILAFAQGSTLGVIEAAVEHSRGAGPNRWVIGSEVDWSLEIGSALRPSLLTSAVRRQDVAIVETIRMFTDGTFAAGTIELGLAEGAVGLARSEHMSSEDLATLGSLSAAVASGEVTVPLAPTGDLFPPVGSEVLDTIIVTWDGDTGQHDGPSAYPPRSTLQIQLINESAEHRKLYALDSPRGVQVSMLALPFAEATGFLTTGTGQIALYCEADLRNQQERPPPTEPAVTLTASTD